MLWTGAAAGLAIFAASLRLTNRESTRILRRRLWAYVLELRLYGADPVLAASSLGHILALNFRLAWAALVPILAASPIIAPLAVSLNAHETRTPLDTGGAAVVTVRLAHWATVRIETLDGLRADAPPVRVPSENEISLRIRGVSARGAVQVTCQGETEQLHGTLRTRSFIPWLLHPIEPRLPAGVIQEISIATLPDESHWPEWFAGIALTTAWALRLAMVYNPLHA